LWLCSVLIASLVRRNFLVFAVTNRTDPSAELAIGQLAAGNASP